MELLARLLKNSSWIVGLDNLAEALKYGAGQEEGPDINYGRSATIIRGLLAEESSLMVAELEDDIWEMKNRHRGHRSLTVADSVSNAQVLAYLPKTHVNRYDDRFAQQFLVAAEEVIKALSEGWYPLPTLAHKLACWVLLERTEATANDLASTEGLSIAPEWRETLNDLLFDGLDFTLLYDPVLAGLKDEVLRRRIPENLNFDHWFTQLDPDQASESL